MKHLFKSLVFFLIIFNSCNKQDPIQSNITNLNVYNIGYVVTTVGSVYKSEDGLINKTNINCFVYLKIFQHIKGMFHHEK